MRQQFLNIIIGLLIILIVSCSSEKSSTATVEKITFPAVNFTISPTADTTLFGAQGTRIFIEKETFQYADGTPVSDSIKIELKEYYKKSDIILADLSTQSNDKLLETAGMLNIIATSKGQTIEIKNNKRVVIHFPKPQNTYKQMNLFFADKNSNDSSATNWDVDTINLVKKTLKLGSFGWWCPAFDDSTEYNFTPKNYVDTGYYWNPLDFYISAYNFSPETKNEIEKHLNSKATFDDWNDYGVECQTSITTDGWIKNPKVNSKVSNSTKNEILKFLNGLPQLKPGMNKYGQIIERKGLLFIQGGNVLPLYKTSEEYAKSFNKKYSKFEKRPIKNIDAAELEYYIFSVTKLGWINCDRFLETDKTIDYFVQIPIDNSVKIKMIFKDIDGVLMAKYIDGKYVFPKVPVDRQVTIFAIKNIDGQFQSAFQDLTISKKPLDNLVFKETTLTELKQQLENLINDFTGLIDDK